MDIEITVVDAFTDCVFKGNPAAVIVTDDWLSDELMQSIASENNLSETAFLVQAEPEIYHIRWFSPLTEIAFCGHATLASAFVLFERNPKSGKICFSAKAIGNFTVGKAESGKIQMNFPSTKPQRVESIRPDLVAGLSIPPEEVYRNSQAYFVKSSGLRRIEWRHKNCTEVA